MSTNLHDEGQFEGNQSISIDYTPSPGDNQDFTLVKPFLLDLSTWNGIAYLVLHIKMNKQIEKFITTYLVGEKSESSYRI